MSNTQGYPQDLWPEEVWGGAQNPVSASQPTTQAAPQSSRHEDDSNTPEAMLKSGAIMQAYGKNDMVSVNPAPGIHKIRWSIVKLKTGGREHLDFYMKMDDMRRLCEEILDGTAAKRIKADNSPYPSAYRFVGGIDGCRELLIGKAQKGVAVVVKEKRDGKWAQKFLPVSYSALQDMAFYHNLVMGITSAGYYYGRLAKVFWKAQNDRIKK